MALTGRCACGAVSARIEGEPVAVRECWCRQCQQLSGGGATYNAIFPLEGIRLTGTLTMHAYLAASGNTLTKSFCGVCGTPVMSQSSARPQYRTVRLGFLDEGHGLAPLMAIWTDDAPGWAKIDPALETCAGQPVFKVPPPNP